MLWRFSGSVLCGSVGVGGWVASLVLASARLRSFLLAGSRFGSVLGWGCGRGLFARGGCVLWQFHRAVPCCAPKGGFPLRTAGAAFLGFSGGLCLRGFRLGSGGFGGGGVQKNLTRGVVCFGGSPVRFRLARWFRRFWFSNRQVKVSFSRRSGACQARFFPFFPGSPPFFRLRW